MIQWDIPGSSICASSLMVSTNVPLLVVLVEQGLSESRTPGYKFQLYYQLGSTLDESLWLSVPYQFPHQ